MSKRDLKTKLLSEEHSAEGGQQDSNQTKILQARMNEAKGQMSKAVKNKKLKNLEVEEQLREKLQKQKKEEKESALSTKCIFYTYGVFDILIFSTLLIYELIHKKGFMIVIILLIYTPNIILLVLVIIFDNVAMRKWYQSWLRFKLATQGFLLPLIFMAYDESFFEAKICSAQLKQFGVDKTEAELQKIIDDKQFTLLFDSRKSTLKLDNLETPQDNEQSYITELKRKISNAKIILNKRLSPEATKEVLSLTESPPAKNTPEDTNNDKVMKGAPQLPLNAEEIAMKKIQLCATGVVLTSMVIVIVYQIASGHQYFVARRWSIEKENSQMFQDNLLIRFNTDHESKMEKFTQGDPDFLLKELERAAEALENQIKRRGTTYSSGSQQAQGYSINS